MSWSTHHFLADDSHTLTLNAVPNGGRTAPAMLAGTASLHAPADAAYDLEAAHFLTAAMVLATCLSGSMLLYS